MIVYLARNKLNGKGYVGITTCKLTKRRKQHERSALQGGDVAFHRALRKHGIESFEWSILREASSVEELLQLEVRMIAELGTYGTGGYNMTFGGEGGLGMKQSPETREKHRLARLGRVDSPETREKKSSYARSRPMEHRVALSESLRGKTVPEERRARISGTLTGRKLSVEHRSRISTALQDPEIKERIKAANRRENWSPERLRRLSESASKPVIQLTLEGVEIARFPSITVAARVTGISGGGITHVLRGRNGSSGGYDWRYVKEGDQQGSQTKVEVKDGLSRQQH